jgi:hypothetical protein
VTIRVSVSDRNRLHELAARLRRAAATLQTRLTNAVREEGRPALAEVRSAWLTIEVTSSADGGEHSGLRARAAAATKSQPIGQGVAFTVDGTAVDPRYPDLVLSLDGLRGWRHPVFGNRRLQERQAGQEVFYRTLSAHARRWETRLERECDQVAREIEG